MKVIAVTLISFSLFSSVAAEAQMGVGQVPASPTQGSHAITITRSGSQQSSQASVEHMTGSVRIEPHFSAHDPSRVSGGKVTFEPGARTAWHTQPLGQTLIITAGTGWIQQWGGSFEEIRQDDAVRIPPGTKQWHGATATTSMTHIAIQEQPDGKTVEWMEKVSDEQCGNLRSFRIDHATEERVIGVLKAARDASGWDTRPSPRKDTPEIKVVLINNPKVGSYGGGSEAPNALAAPAIAAALHDATGKVMRRLPMKPAYVQAALKA